MGSVRLDIHPDFASHANGITAGRMILALMVVASHSFTMAGLTEPLVAETGQVSLGLLAVYGFFGLSGYLLTISRQRTSTTDFLWNRALRILPGYWLALVFGAMAATLAAAIIGQRLGTADAVAYVVSNVALVSGIERLPPAFGGALVNGSLLDPRRRSLLLRRPGPNAEDIAQARLARPDSDLRRALDGGPVLRTSNRNRFCHGGWRVPPSLADYHVGIVRRLTNRRRVLRGPPNTYRYHRGRIWRARARWPAYSDAMRSLLWHLCLRVSGREVAGGHKRLRVGDRRDSRWNYRRCDSSRLAVVDLGRA